MKKTINMLSSATKIKGQGVGSAYIEQVNLVRDGLSDIFDVSINKVGQFDIQHFHTVDLKFFLSEWTLKRKGVSVGYVHMLPETVEESLQMPRLFKSVFFKYMIQFYKNMDYLVTVNPYFIGELEKYGINKNKVTYIPNYVSNESFYPIAHDEKMIIRQKYGIDTNAFVVLSAGQLQVRKGIFDFLKIAEKMPDIQFVWAGGFSFGKISDGYEEIKKIVDNPPKNVLFLGIVDREEMNAIFNMADVMLLASFEELFPMTILEAMCANIPIVLRDLEIYEDILFDFYEKTDNVDGFVSLIQRLKDDTEFYNTAVQNAKRGNQFYSRESVLKMWREFYLSILKNK